MSLIDRYVSEVQKFTDSPLVFLKAIAYFAVGAACRKRVFYGTQKSIHPNLYLVLTSPPNKFRKTTAAEFSLDLLRKGIPSNHFMPQSGSDVAFDDAIAEAEGYGIVYYEEFAEFINLTSSESNSQLVSRFNRYYYPSPIAYKNKTRKEGSKTVPAGSVISVLSACTEDDLFAFLSKDSIGTGLLSRFLVISPTAKDSRPELENPPKVSDDWKSAWSRELIRILPKSTQKVEVTFSDDAKDALSGWSRAYADWEEREGNPDLSKGTTRAIEHLRRLAVIRAISRESTEVSGEDVDTAWGDLVLPAISTVKRFMKFSSRSRPDQVLRAKIVHVVGKGPTTERVLSRMLNERMESVRKELSELKVMGEVHAVSEGHVKVWEKCDGICEDHKDNMEEDLVALEKRKLRVQPFYGTRKFTKEDMV